MATRKFLFQATEGYHEEAALGDDTQLAKLVLTGLSGVALDVSGQLISNVGAPVTGTDAANKAYVDAAAVGIDWKPSVRAATTANITLSGLQTIDGVSITAGQRVLVKNQTDPTENGPYVAAAGAWTRSTDADVDAEVTPGLAVFVEEGTVNADSGWLLTSDGTVTVGTSSLTFTQFTGLGSVVAGAGLLRTGNQLDVELDTGANAQGAGSGGGSSGLEFDASGVGGKLRAAVDPTGGVQRSASGLAALLNGTTLQSGASGLSVKGLPSLFEVNAIATSANVTAANLNTLTGGGNANGLHTHEKVAKVRTAAGAIAKASGVYYSADDVVSTGDCTADAKSRIIGVADAAIADTAQGNIVSDGVITGALSGATFNTRYFLGSTGLPVLIGALPAGARTVQLGIAKNATDLDVQVFDYGKKAA